MRMLPSDIEGAFVVQFDDHADERGHFARTYCEAAFADAGIDLRISQVNFSRNTMALTLRGLHYQAEPHEEPKMVQCVAGRIFDVAVDLRPHSPTFRQWAAVELAPDVNRAFYIPGGCAHGFLTLEAQSHITYLMGAPFVEGAGRGVRWDDPAFNIAWPAPPEVMSTRDANFPDFSDIGS
jgi:dTDP-4-dehydrorhamnose 3,5-epimerase